MEIFKHLIRTKEIIGMGPLYVQPSRDPAMISLYGSFRYLFEVHTKTRSIEITSDYYNPGHSGSNDAKEVAKINEWEAKYYRYRDDIEKLIECPQ